MLIAAAIAAEPPTLTIHADRPGPRVNPTLFGIFFEEINHSGDGGLYAERVRNRDFRDVVDGKPVGWSLRLEGGAQATLTLGGAHSLHVDVSQAPTGSRVSLVNDGYWGIAMKKGASYALRVQRSGATALDVTLESDSIRAVARRRFDGLSPESLRIEGDLVSDRDEPSARLVVSASASFSLDFVSLVPRETWKRRPNGMRADLAEKLAALQPAFVRFPGGCFVEGDRLENAFRWKTTLGDVASRPGHWNDNWGYRSTDGLGFHEYLQLCEDLGAAPLFVVNCGMAHRDVVPMDKLDPWIQDALDAIEYANGPATSEWGAKRAANGHAAPFGLRFVEIGNENGGAAYAERYRAFRDAIHAKHPDVQTIADGVVPHAMDLVDEHYYSSPGWFWTNADRYDHADRKGPRIYVGEYAVTQACGRGNLRAALAEAAFMTGLQRNSDVVAMASYAPLFVNANDRRWNPDLIVFDSARSYGTPSYHVQQLFAENRPDVVLSVEISEVPSVPVDASGTIGVGTWRTQAEFKDIVVRGGFEAIASANFEEGASEWHASHGDWIAVDGALRQSSRDEDCRDLFAIPALTGAGDYQIELKARKLGGDEGFLVLFHARDDANFFWWNVGGWGNREHGIEKGVDGSKIQVGAHVAGSIDTGRWYALRVAVGGSHIRCYLDGALVHDVVDTPVPTLAATAGRRDATGEIVIEVVNGSDAAVPAIVRTSGVTALEPTGSSTVLTSASLDDENSFEEPDRVAPRDVPLGNAATEFAHTFAPRSLTVLRLKEKR